ncbi:hypothetical protein QQP08_010653 [Theobroma cacao]|nr:hypothetical protein QQP08_010653 [Theobroma cacao]
MLQSLKHQIQGFVLKVYWRTLAATSLGEGTHDQCQLCRGQHDQFQVSAFLCGTCDEFPEHRDNPGASGSPSQGSSFIESPPFIKAISISNQEAPPTEDRKKLVELFQYPFWSDLLVQHQNFLSIYREKERVQLFQDWLWIEQSMSLCLSKTPCIVNRKSLEPFVLGLPWEFTDLAP